MVVVVVTPVVFVLRLLKKEIKTLKLVNFLPKSLFITIYCIKLYTVFILAAWPVSVLIYIIYWCWSVVILVGILSTKEFGANS